MRTRHTCSCGSPMDHRSKHCRKCKPKHCPAPGEAVKPRETDPGWNYDLSQKLLTEKLRIEA